MAHVTQGALLAEISKDASALTADAQALAKAINNKNYKQADVYRIADRCADYIQEQHDKRQPLTVAGFILASGVPSSTWYDMKNEKMDSITALYAMEHPQQVTDEGEPYFVDDDTGDIKPLVTPSAVCKNAYLLIQAQLEGNCYTNKGNPAGSIFGLKAQFGWSDDTTPQSVTQNLVICDAEQARKALKMLND